MPRDPVTIRTGTEKDLPQVAAIQAACPEAARWEVRDYLAHDLLVAEHLAQVAGFAAARPLAPDESEILTLAVAPEMRRRGIGQALLKCLSKRHPGALFLEVRESNQGARDFYQAVGFKEVGYRPKYYEAPPERAVVMKFHSCYCHK